VGIIPKGKYNVRVYLNSQSDLDINIYDLSETSRFSEGKAIVNFCFRPQDNCGVIGGSPSAQETNYKGMRILYSGFQGDGQNFGNEYIEILGETTVDISMKVYTYRTGQAKVNYNWDNSPCCAGTAPCSGSFTVNVPSRGLVTLGDIPPGKKDVAILLTSASDIDIQLFDLDTKTLNGSQQGFEDGNAIVAWCPAPDCNKGILGMDPDEKSATYKGSTIIYSGFRGTGGMPGNEFVRVEGLTSSNMRMKVYGYTSGPAQVDYTYFNVVR